MSHKKSTTLSAAILVTLATALASACSERRDVDLGREAEIPSFTAPDAGDAGAEEDAFTPDVSMCPVTTCSAPWVTCATSKFPCDVNVLYDDENCGGCGIRCPGSGGKQDSWTCVAGECVHSCQKGYGDCDGDPSNGCEAYLLSNFFAPITNCGECGRACPDGQVCSNSTCVDLCTTRPGMPDKCGPTTCVNFQTDDRNCGSCGVVCDRMGPNLPRLPPDAYYGCTDGECGKAKCLLPIKADCNDDPSDGCETRLNTNDHCTGCNDKCPAGKTCMNRDGVWGCQCADGETVCGSTCVTLGDDPLNCGACNNACPGRLRPHFEPSCTFGVCGGACENGYADCDGLKDNGCETNTRVDNRNCGGCGIACLPDQVCSGGTCLFAPCEGAGTTK